MTHRHSIMSCSDASIVSRQDSIKESHMDDSENLETRFIVVGTNIQNNRQVQRALTYFKTPVVSSDTGLEYVADKSYNNVFILEDFMGGPFHMLRDRNQHVRIIGPTLIIKHAEMKELLPKSSRPLYSMSMKSLIVCFTGLKAHLAKLADLVHFMGGSIRRDFSPRVTHLIANQTAGDKYRIAVSLGTPIMSADWVYKAWESRDDVLFTATSEDMMQYKMSTFYNCCLSFLGFPPEEEKHMEELTIKNGGSCVPAGDSQCTHLVVEEHNVKQINCDTHKRLKIVKSEWFWGSIQMEACAEEEIYSFNQPSNNKNVTPVASNMTGVTPRTLSGTLNRKRKRLRDNLAHLASEGEMDSPYLHQIKRCSSEFMLTDSSMFDSTMESISATPGKPESINTPASQVNTPKVTARQQVVMELLHTETNYVGILHTVLELFKKGIEDPDQRGGPLLEPREVRDIFGTIPSIYEVHCKIKGELEQIIASWKDDKVIGNVILKNSECLKEAYPPFVNFFEKTKATIEKCDKENPRFHAFLMKCRNRPECGRQTLTELLIRPVQRLPSVSLLLSDILKRTKKDVEDLKLLDKAKEALKEVMTHINEDKRKTEGQVVMFDIVNDIDNCPPNLLSSHRRFIMKLDCIEITDTLLGKGDNVTLFLFSDSVELCKRRSRGNFKSPAVTKTPQKAYKHIELLSLSSIKRVVDILETDECKNVFALVCRPPMLTKEVLFGFTVINDDFNKEEFLKTLCKYMADSVCRTDYENLLASMEARDLDISVGDIYNKSKVSRFGKRVSRAFSFKQTPLRLRRAMSSISQVVASPFLSDHPTNTAQTTIQETPTRQAPGLRLAASNISSTYTPPSIVIDSYNSFDTVEGTDLSDHEGEPPMKSIAEHCREAGGHPNTRSLSNNNVLNNREHSTNTCANESPMSYVKARTPMAHKND